MITDSHFYQKWLELLERDIYEQMSHYRDAVAKGYAQAAHHKTAERQCAIFNAQLATMLADPRWPTFQARYPNWTNVAIAGVQQSLTMISASIVTGTAQTVLESELQ